MSVKELAQKVIDAYAHDPEGLTREECAALTEDPKQADMLCSALGNGPKGMLDGYEYLDLLETGFDDELIKYIFIKDGGALSERVKWFADQPANREALFELMDVCTGGKALWDEAAEVLCRLFEGADEATRESMRGWLREKLDTLENPPTIVRKLHDLFSEGDFISREYSIVSQGDLHIKQYGDREKLSFVHDNAGALVGVMPGTVEVWKIDDGLIVNDFNGAFPAAFDAELTTKGLGERIELLWECLDELPGEMFRDLKLLMFSSLCDYKAFAMYTSGYVVIGCYIANRDIAHELTHHWDYTLAPGADLLFNRISWQERGWLWRRRCRRKRQCFRHIPHQVRGDRYDYDRSDFLHPQATINENEDLARSAEYYVADAERFRWRARDQMDQGNFELAAKYLFVKHVMPFKGREYDVDERWPALTIEEVKEKYLAAKDTSKTNPGTYDIILEIEKGYPLTTGH